MPILLALCSNIAFATASIFYTSYTKKISAEWMNFYKAFVSTFGFVIVCTALNLWMPLSQTATLLLIASGLSGLMIGDIFLLKAFASLGPGRTLMVFGFQPLILGVSSYFLFGQEFSWYKLTAIIFLMACLFTFSLETFRSKGHWDLRGLLYAGIGVFLDAGGILMTRQAFEMSPGISPFLVNAIRCIACVVGFGIMSCLPFMKFSLTKPWQKISLKDRGIVTGASLLGTFVSLSFYLMAVQKGHLASISAVAGTSPLFATLMETLVGRKKMTIYLALGTMFFLAGFGMLI